MVSKQIVIGAAYVCLAAAAWVSLRGAIVDQLWRAGRADAVLTLAPGHTPARLRRGAPADLEQAAFHTPTASQPLLRLALAAEARGDLDTARAHLDEAVRRDATFAPRWARINFLMRRADHEGVLSQAAQAAARYEGDLTALFDLCLRTGAASERIYRTVTPARAKAQREFLELLLARGRAEEAIAAALRLADLARPRDRDLLYSYCGELLDAGVAGKAAQLWKGLPHDSAVARGRCLDWRQGAAVAGIHIVETTESAVRLELSGRQPESAAVLSRPIVVEPGRRYRLRALASGGDTMKGAVEWRWDGEVAGDGRSADLEVEARRAISELALFIRRRPGERAAEGDLEITNIRVEPKAAALAGRGFPSGPRP